jgi:hypothetical protein
MRRALVWLAVCATAACTFTRDLGYLHTEATTAEDSGTEVAEAGKSKKPDASVDADADLCPSGKVIPPTEVVPFEGAVPQGQTPQAVTCHPENILVNDGLTTNLDRTMNGSDGRATLAGEYIAGCIGVRFDRDVDVAGVKLGPIADGCGVQPCDPDPSAAEQCNTATGWQALLYAGVDEKPENLKLVRLLRYAAAGDTLRDQISVQTNDHPPISGARVLIVCRNGNVSAFRDDVAVDAIWAECK